MSVKPGFPRYQPVPFERLEEASPSRTHGIDWPTELSYRRVVSGLIYNTASGPNYLKLALTTAARAVFLFNRFYARCSFHSYDRWHIAPACILLASKIDNSPRTARDVATAFYVARCSNKYTHLIHKVHEPAWVESQVQLLVAAERDVLFALNFDLVINLPNTGWLIPQVKALGLPYDEICTPAASILQQIYTHKQKIDAIVLTATNTGEDIGKAILAMVLMAKDMSPPLPGGACYSDHVGMAAGDLVKICEKMRALFAAGARVNTLTAEEMRAWMLKPSGDGATAAAAAAAEVPSGGATAAAAADCGGAATAATGAPDANSPPAPLADSPPTAHDSASSHQLMGGTALASRKRGREEGPAGACGGDEPAAKQQQQEQTAAAVAAAGGGLA